MSKSILTNKDIKLDFNEKDEKLYGWYSQKQSNLYQQINNKYKYNLNRPEKRPKYNIYLTKDGKEVSVTWVSTSNNRNDFNFDDIVFKGEVVRWIRSIF